MSNVISITAPDDEPFIVETAFELAVPHEELPDPVDATGPRTVCDHTDEECVFVDAHRYSVVAVRRDEYRYAVEVPSVTAFVLEDVFAEARTELDVLLPGAAGARASGVRVGVPLGVFIEEGRVPREPFDEFGDDVLGATPSFSDDIRKDDDGTPTAALLAATYEVDGGVSLVPEAAEPRADPSTA